MRRGLVFLLLVMIARTTNGWPGGIAVTMSSSRAVWLKPCIRNENQLHMKTTMSSEVKNASSMDSLMGLLASSDGMTRQKARSSLVTLGKPGVPSIIRALEDSTSDHLRWEAAKTLGAIGDTTAIPALVKALTDNDPDVGWVAAEALRKFNKAAWIPLLRALLEGGPDIDLLRRGAHHVLRNQEDPSGLLAILMKALESNEVPDVAAYNILKRMDTIP
jgi:HEAT repeat protein